MWFIKTHNSHITARFRSHRDSKKKQKTNKKTNKKQPNPGARQTACKPTLFIIINKRCGLLGVAWLIQLIFPLLQRLMEGSGVPPLPLPPPLIYLHQKQDMHELCCSIIISCCCRLKRFVMVREVLFVCNVAFGVLSEPISEQVRSQDMCPPHSINSRHSRDSRHRVFHRVRSYF